MVDINDLKVGDKVRALFNINSPADEHSPAMTYAKKGDILVVRNIHESFIEYNVSVSHEDVLDSAFGLNCNEIEKLENTVTIGWRPDIVTREITPVDPHIRKSEFDLMVKRLAELELEVSKLKESIHGNQ